MGHCHAPPKQDQIQVRYTCADQTHRPCLETSVSFTVIQIPTRLPHVFETQSPGAFPGFHPAEGSKALRLRFHAVIRGFAGFPALEPRSAIASPILLLSASIASPAFRFRRFAGLRYQPTQVDFQTLLRSSPGAPTSPRLPCDVRCGYKPLLTALPDATRYEVSTHPAGGA